MHPTLIRTRPSLVAASLVVALCAGAARAVEEPVTCALLALPQPAAADEAQAPAERLRRRVVALFTIAPEWHLYWRNPGASGAPPTVSLELPEGVTATAFEWPAPTIAAENGEPIYIYEERLALFTWIEFPAKTPPTIHATMSWFACHDFCVIGKAKASLALTDAEPSEELVAELVAIERTLPRPLPVDAATVAADRVVIALDPAARASADGAATVTVTFLSEARPGVRLGALEVGIADGRTTLAIPYSLEPANALGQPPVLAGLIFLGDGEAAQALAVDLPLTPATLESPR